MYIEGASSRCLNAPPQVKEHGTSILSIETARSGIETQTNSPFNVLPTFAPVSLLLCLLTEVFIEDPIEHGVTAWRGEDEHLGDGVTVHKHVPFAQRGQVQGVRQPAAFNHLHLDRIEQRVTDDDGLVLNDLTGQVWSCWGRCLMSYSSITIDVPPQYYHSPNNTHTSWHTQHMWTFSTWQTKGSVI